MTDSQTNVRDQADADLLAEIAKSLDSPIGKILEPSVGNFLEACKQLYELQGDQRALKFACGRLIATSIAIASLNHVNPSLVAVEQHRQASALLLEIQLAAISEVAAVIAKEKGLTR